MSNLNTAEAQLSIPLSFQHRHRPRGLRAVPPDATGRAVKEECKELSVTRARSGHLFPKTPGGPSQSGRPLPLTHTHTTNWKTDRPHPAATGHPKAANPAWQSRPWNLLTQDPWPQDSTKDYGATKAPANRPRLQPFPSVLWMPSGVLLSSFGKQFAHKNMAVFFFYLLLLGWQVGLEKIRSDPVSLSCPTLPQPPSSILDFHSRAVPVIYLGWDPLPRALQLAIEGPAQYIHYRFPCQFDSTLKVMVVSPSPKEPGEIVW